LNCFFSIYFSLSRFVSNTGDNTHEEDLFLRPRRASREGIAGWLVQPRRFVIRYDKLKSNFHDIVAIGLTVNRTIVLRYRSYLEGCQVAPGPSTFARALSGASRAETKAGL
jgi:hypothetical protein